jgi:hypothetical protein
MNKLQVRVSGSQLQVGTAVITFHRTLRIPDDGKQYPLPPSLGAFPIGRVQDFADRVPASWRAHEGVFLPMYQREAMWLGFAGSTSWKPNALKVAVGKVNALSGERWSEKLRDSGTRSDAEQDYMVIPNQPWLDGINAGDGFIKQFVAMPLGMGYTVEGQVTGEEKHGGVQLCVFPPKPDKFISRPSSPLRGHASNLASGQSLWPPSAALYANTSRSQVSGWNAASASVSASLGPDLKGQEMGLAAGGRMKQKIYPDSYGIDTWDEENSARVFVHLVNAPMWTAITGLPMPPTPVSVQAYANAGYPWFDLYDEEKGDLAPSSVLEGVKSTKELDDEKGFVDQQDDTSVEVPDSVITKYGAENLVRDGDW